MKYQIRLYQTMIRTVDVEVEITDLKDALNITDLARAEAPRNDSNEWQTVKLTYTHTVLT